MQNSLENALINYFKLQYEINVDIIEKIINDFKQMGISEFIYLRDLIRMVIEKKNYCDNLEESKICPLLAFSYEECEKEAIDYYSTEHCSFAENYYYLITDGVKEHYSNLEYIKEYSDNDDENHMKYIKKC